MSVYSAWVREPEGMRRALLGPDAETMRRWLAFLRIAVGALYVYAFVTHLLGDFVAGFPDRVLLLAANNNLFMARSVLSGYVAGHPVLFGWGVMLIELLAGSLLVLGLGTRFVAGLAALLQLIYLWASFGSSTVALLANVLFIAALLVILGTSGGWRWSLDEMIINRR